LRRTIWDGNQELAEIQMPWSLEVNSATGDTTQYTSLWENDVNPLTLTPLPLLTMFSQTGDPNPYFGHVIYAGRQDIDQPIAITRVNYVMGLDWNSRNSYNPVRMRPTFTIVPFWNPRGDAPVGVFGNGDQFLCGVPHIGAGADTGCVAIRWPFNWSSSDRSGGLAHDSWLGTLLGGKRDASGFTYMRNRYYDPLTGRFTQEDPIGLAGGLNAYGFAKGDPINYADPFGLTPCSEHHFQDFDTYEVHQTKGVTITITLHHDCSKERKAEEQRQQRLQQQRQWEDSLNAMDHMCRQHAEAAAGTFANGEAVETAIVGAGLGIATGGTVAAAAKGAVLGQIAKLLVKSRRYSAALEACEEFHDQYWPPVE
jgi:RHS repeat-associated protein